MKLLDRLVLKDLIPMFFVGVGMFSALWFAGGPVLLATRYLGQGVAWPIVLSLVSLSIPDVLSLTFPMGMLLATLLGYGRLSADSEAVALFAGGIPFLRIALPAAILGLIVSFGGYVINDRIASSANRRIADIKEMALKEVGETSKPFYFADRQNGALQATVQVEKGFDVRAKVMRDVTITMFDAQGKATATFQAETAQWQGGKQWTLRNVAVNHLGENANYAFFQQLKSFKLEKTPENVAFLERDPGTMSFHELRQQITELRAGGTGDLDIIRDKEVGLWSKIALPFSSLVFAMVGSPLGLKPQRTSKTTGWTLAILIIFAYYVLYSAMGSVARHGGVSPVVAAFLPNIIGVIVGTVLCWRATR